MPTLLTIDDLVTIRACTSGRVRGRRLESLACLGEGLACRIEHVLYGLPVVDARMREQDVRSCSCVVMSCERHCPKRNDPVTGLRIKQRDRLARFAAELGVTMPSRAALKRSAG